MGNECELQILVCVKEARKVYFNVLYNKVTQEFFELAEKMNIAWIHVSLSGL